MTRAATIARREALRRESSAPSKLRLNWGFIAGLVFCALTWGAIALLVARAL